jgi:putative lipase involved disintegration of autophagic bodies
VGYVLKLDIFGCKKVVHHNTILIGGHVLLGTNSPVGNQFSTPVQAQDGIGIAYVNGK